MRSPAAGVACLLVALLAALWAVPAAAQLSDADVFVAQAILAYENRRYDEALGLLAEALAQDPDNVDALYYQGLTLVAQQRLAPAAEALERARAKVPADFAIRFQLGVAYFAMERYEAAEPLLGQVFAERPATDGLGYYVGFLRYRKRDYEGAIQAFRAGATADPTLQQLTRFYAGLALAALGRTEQAAAEVAAAIRTQATALTGPAERLRDTLLAARERDRRFHAELRVGFVHDSNVAVTPEPSRDPTAEAARRPKRVSSGEIGSLRLDYAWLRTGPWESTLTYSFFQTYYNDLPSFNLQNHLGAASLLYTGSVAALPYQLGAQYAYDYLTLDDLEFLQRHTATAFATLVESGLHLTTLQGRLQTKEFSDDSNIAREESRDAKNWMVGLAHVLRFSSDRHFLRAGYQLDIEDADGRNWKYLGHRYLVGGQYTLPWGGMRLKYDFDVHVRGYRHAHTLLPAVNPESRERTDVEQTHVFRAEQPLPLGLTLAAEYQGIVARSNLPLFSFNRNVFAVTLSWQY